jgi:FixJ family two-component response regulator
MICSIVSIVDDDPVVRDSTVDLLNSCGYTALGFETAEGFINSGEVANTSCLITDQQLPGLSGTDLQSYLCAAGYRTPIIFITAHHVPTIRERALAAGAIAYLAKPFDDSVLLDYLQTALGARQPQSKQQRF